MTNIIHNDPWEQLKSFTAARIALGRTGHAIPLREVLQFRMAHAHARDAVFSGLEVDELRCKLPWETNKAADRAAYLQRPDKGRKLAVSSAESVYTCNTDIAIVLADSLSATAVNHHGRIQGHPARWTGDFAGCGENILPGNNGPAPAIDGCDAEG